ncbi:thiamine diphosphokinase [Bifidobacterium olomucense]|uniref:Thiamine diphosphokinase n=1 Tax=Bifidobacterium olomucense TaxID=2675324 RepID=A0A7Y0HVY5_9BIFI|nr:thiamine diphosphokinase [Bifidobacterium sp. DSM 109959]NMM97711.1 thiamine pyrophosphokinase [Bifidobacterium sp. DSM 109959]
MSKICVIFGAGEYYAGDPMVPDGAYVVAADGGLDHTRQLGIAPDVIVGDFDSLAGHLPQDGTYTIALPPLKDDPDMLSALKVGWAAGCREFRVYGGLGGRIDHSISCMQLMALLSRHGASGYLYGDGLIVTAITDGSLFFRAHPVPEDGRMVSVFSHSDVSLGVNEPGLKYELRDGTLTNTMVQGVSNEFRDNVDATISVNHGTLIVTFPIEVALPKVDRLHDFDGGIGELDTAVSKLLVR